MLRICFRLFCISILLLFFSCAPKEIAVPPSLEGRDIRGFLEEKDTISSIETSFAILFEKPDAEISGKGTLTISNTGDLKLSVYSFGFLAMELTSRNGIIKSNPPLDRNKKRILTQGLRDCLFWWGIRDFIILDDGPDHLLKNSEREIWIDKKTFLPKKQKIYFDDGRELTIFYDNPEREKDFWYQAQMRIELSKYAVTLSVSEIAFRM